MVERHRGTRADAHLIFLMVLRDNDAKQKAFVQFWRSMEYFLSIFFGSFVLEDVALASGVALVAANKMEFWTAFTACFLGISLSDLGLYIAGRLLSRLGTESFLKRFVPAEGLSRSSALALSVGVARMIPGTRLPTFLGAGFFRLSFWRFMGVTVVSVGLWVGAAFVWGNELKRLFGRHWVIGVVLFVFGLKVLRSLGPKLLEPWQRKALWQSWRKWRYFEFWPALVFYIPIVPFYAFLAVRHRGLLTPFYASPNLTNGGLIGESKWDFLRHLSTAESSTLKAFKLDLGIDIPTAKERIKEAGFAYPYIVKPDVGQRGYGVRIIGNESLLEQYLAVRDFDLIVQNLSSLSREAGLFYVRKPSESVGSIFSITDKTFPVVLGDGKTSLGDLILRDTRARMIAPVYFERLKSKLDSVPQLNEAVQLAECGNHCQGAIFFDGNSMCSDALTAELDRIAKQIPEFYFGRFDVRYKDADALRRGESFEIVEVNGAGSEATHIWDPKSKLVDAYKTLYQQWSLLFAIGAAVRDSGHSQANVRISSLLKECARVFWRNDTMSVSS